MSEDYDEIYDYATMMTYYHGTKFYILYSEYDREIYKDGYFNLNLHSLNLLTINGIEFIEQDYFVSYIHNNIDVCYCREFELVEESYTIVNKDICYTTAGILGKEFSLKNLNCWDNEEKCKEIVSKFPKCIKFMKNKNESLYLLAIDKCPEVLEYIDEDDQTENICFTAIIKDDDTTQFAKKINKDICKYILENCYDESILTYLPEELVERESYIKYILNNKEIPKRRFFDGRDIYVELINRDPEMVVYIDDIDEELLLMAIRKDPTVIRFINKKDQTEKICIETVSRDGILISYIDNPTIEMYFIAIMNNEYAMHYVPIEQESYNFCYHAFLLNKKCLEHIYDNEIKKYLQILASDLM